MDRSEIEALIQEVNTLIAGASTGPWRADHKYEMFIGHRHVVLGPAGSPLICGNSSPTEWTTSPPKETERSVKRRMLAHGDSEFIGRSRDLMPKLAAALSTFLAE